MNLFNVEQLSQQLTLRFEFKLISSCGQDWKPAARIIKRKLFGIQQIFANGLILLSTSMFLHFRVWSSFSRVELETSLLLRGSVFFCLTAIETSLKICALRPTYWQSQQDIKKKIVCWLVGNKSFVQKNLSKKEVKLAETQI